MTCAGRKAAQQVVGPFPSEVEVGQDIIVRVRLREYPLRAVGNVVGAPREAIDHDRGRRRHESRGQLLRVDQTHPKVAIQLPACVSKVELCIRGRVFFLDQRGLRQVIDRRIRGNEGRERIVGVELVQVHRQPVLRELRATAVRGEPLRIVVHHQIRAHVRGEPGGRIGDAVRPVAERAVLVIQSDLEGIEPSKAQRAHGIELAVPDPVGGRRLVLPLLAEEVVIADIVWIIADERIADRTARVLVRVVRERRARCAGRPRHVHVRSRLAGLAEGALGVDLPVTQPQRRRQRVRRHLLVVEEAIGLQPREHVGARPRRLDALRIDRFAQGRLGPERVRARVEVVSLVPVVGLGEIGVAGYRRAAPGYR